MLALAQSRWVADKLMRVHEGFVVEPLFVVTTGDRIQDRSLVEIGGKGLFVKEIEQALQCGEARFAVHSVKDMPAVLAPGLVLACVPVREDPRDAFLSRSGICLSQVAPGTRVGTSSLRRRMMLSRARPDLRFEPLRGNVDTRMRKVREGVVDATVLAQAGLCRLGMEDVATEVFDAEVILPAVGQGALGIECREDDVEMRELLSVLNDAETAVAVAVERGVLVGAAGSCQLPIAAYACRDAEGLLWLRAMLATEDGLTLERVCIRCGWPEAGALGFALGIEVGDGLRREVAGRSRCTV